MERVTVNAAVAPAVPLRIEPNPVADRAEVSFDLASPGHVRIDMYDLTGRAMRAILDGGMEAGPHRVRIETEGLPAGLYILELATPGGSTVRPMIVAR